MIQTRKLGRALLGVILIIILIAIIGWVVYLVNQGENDMQNLGDEIELTVRAGEE